MPAQHSRHRQTILLEHQVDRSTYPNLPPSGDHIPQDKDDKHIRIAFQNIHGATFNNGLHVSHEIEVLQDWNIDVMGMSETNRPWTHQQKSEYDYMMNTLFHSSRTTYTSAPSPNFSMKFLPGGNLLTINGHTTGRITRSGTDPMGRFCWYMLRGRRDEGLLIVVAYRVCHEASHNPGPFTAYQQQYTALRSTGIINPNPRRQVLIDLATLINSKRSEGYRPIVLMDANGDYINGRDPDLANFISEAGLCDPFYDKFNHAPTTYVYGRKRIDYIFIDPAHCPSIVRLGYLGTHDGALSDHVMAVMDLDESTLFAGILNRPPPRHSREILLEQDDKIQAFLATVLPLFKEHALQRRTYDLARAFIDTGASIDNITQYHGIYAQLLDLTRGAAKKVGRKKYGYMRSPPLTAAGRQLNAAKMLYDCKVRGAPPSSALHKLCASLDIDATEALSTSSIQDLRRRIRQCRSTLWETQKKCESLRAEWLEQIAQDRSRALNDPDWEKKLKQMKRTVSTCATNRKLTLLTKGIRGTLDRIQIPTQEWYHSHSKQELYHYDQGVFEAYPASPDGNFYSHHTIKIPADDSTPVSVLYNPTLQRWAIQEFLSGDTIEWRDITNLNEMEHALLRRNERHLRQTELERGISTVPPLSLIREHYGFNTYSSSILRGEVLQGLDLSPEMVAYFQALTQTDQEKCLPPISGDITAGDVQSMFRVAKEKTSSDSGTLNYTLWKCIARDDDVAGILSILFSLPFLYGFVNSYWTSMTDFMLEKKQGVRQIHTLRIIGKVAAEFNTCLKFLIGKKTKDNFEACSPSPDQYGFRPNRSSIDAAFLKLLTFESARMQKCTIGMVQHDMTAHFDRMYPAMTSITASKYGVDENIMLCINQTIAALRRRIETGLGVSDVTYGNSNKKCLLGGMVQGKADVPQWSTQQSDAMLRAHDSLTHGLKITSPCGTRSIKHHSTAFADDTDGHVSCPPAHPDPIPIILTNLQHSAQTWSRLVQINGGLLALHKCNWQLIAWEEVRGQLQLVSSMENNLILDDGHGTSAVIAYLPPDKPNVGLGYRLCPDGSQRPHFQATQEAIRKICLSCKGAQLTEAETRQLVNQRLLPKMIYALHLSSFTQPECSRLNTIIRGTILPSLRLNRHFPQAVLHGPSAFGGLEFPDMYTVQLQTQLVYILKQLRWDKEVANDLLVTLDHVQLCSGFVKPILEHPALPILYLGPSYLIDLRRRLHEIEASLWIEHAWTPSLQRIRDEALMERFLTIKGVTTAQLRRANTVRLYLRVITIADLCDPTGTYIPGGMLTGDWQAGSDLQWPHQPLPPKPYFATFRRLLRQTFCTNTPVHHYYLDSLSLDTPLGPWLPVPRTTWFPVYRTADTLLWRRRDDTELFVLVRSETSGFYHYSHTTQSLPLDSHPITYQQIGETIWTQRPYRMHITPKGDALPPGHVIANTLSDPVSDVLTVGSDGSVYLANEVAACAWMIAESPEQAMTACILLSNISSVSSYRSELEGIYRSLVHVRHLGMTPQDLHQWCDNESAVNDSNKPLLTPGAMVKPDADILLAIHHLRTHMASYCNIHCRHIYGHQDTRRRTPAILSPDDTPRIQDEELNSPRWMSPFGAHSDDDDLGEPTSATSDGPTDPHTSQPHTPPVPLSVLSNIECDRLASETSRIGLQGDVRQDLPPTLSPPYPGARAILRIGTTWITSHYKTHILNARWATPIKKYCQDKYGWSQSILDDIAWQSIRAARNKCSPTQLTKTSKIMHDWLPVMHMQAHITGTAQCPSCPHRDETLDHLFHCPHPLLSSKREELLEHLRKKGLKLGAPRPVIEALVQLFISVTHNSPPTTFPSSLIQAASTAQISIGLQYLPRGFLSQQWITALDAHGCNHPHRTLASLIHTILLDITDALWRTRNSIVHGGTNLTTNAQENMTDSKLQWFITHYKDVLSRHDYKLMDHILSSPLDTLTLRVKQQWLLHLQTAQAAHTAYLSKFPAGQQLITTYFGPMAAPHG